MSKESYLEDLARIRGMMEQRVRFQALSGLSGVLAGLYALLGAFVAHRLVHRAPRVLYNDLQEGTYSDLLGQLLLLATAILLAAVLTGLYFSARNARKSGEPLWTPAAQKALFNFAVPMLMGGLFAGALLWRGYLTMIAPSLLVFYGLALVQAANYTVSDIRALGISLLLTASVSLFFPGYGLYFWAFGFGVLHLVYGAIMYLKYER